MRWLLLFGAALLGSSCLTHVGPMTTAYRDVSWAPTLAAAQAEATARGRPLLVVLAAGPRDGRC